MSGTGTTKVERDPKKRRVKPVEQSLIDFQDLGESSDDSDFRIEDHEESDDDDSFASKDSESDDDDDDDDGDDDEEDEEDEEDSDDVVEVKRVAQTKSSKDRGFSIGNLIDEAKQRHVDGLQTDGLKSSPKVLICCACLGERSDDTNEIVECDGCGVSVHEGCYGIADTGSVSSTVSSCSTEPWFCEACKAGVRNPSCELCPNTDGVFKETDVGKWVHLICALYVPGVAFGEVDRLSNVTLFEMPYSRWGAKACTLCEDVRFSRTGVCIGCDVGMCRTYFHVTCAQREGLLSEAHSEEADQADPFYAQCKLHTDKAIMKKRRRNWLALQLQVKERHAERTALLALNVTSDKESDMQRIQRKLHRYRDKYLAHKASRPPPWVPTQKMPRMLTTSASACRKLMHKAKLMGIDTEALEMQESHAAALSDVRKKWHVPAAFSVEFISYFLDRNIRMSSMKRHLQEQLDQNKCLQEEQQSLRKKYDKLVVEHSESDKVSSKLKDMTEMYHKVISLIAPNKKFPMPEVMRSPKHKPSSPSKAFKKSPVMKLKGLKESARAVHGGAKQWGSLPMTLNECGICRQTDDQHLLAKCDTCSYHYHLGCLTPPLTRMPKKTQIYGWQCSECDKESSGSEPGNVDTEAPRQLRHNIKEPAKYSPGCQTGYSPKVVLKRLESPLPSPSVHVPREEKEKKKKKDKDKEKHKEEKRRKKRKLEMTSESTIEPLESPPRIKIKIKAIPMPTPMEQQEASSPPALEPVLPPLSPEKVIIPEEPEKLPVENSLKRQPRTTAPVPQRRGSDVMTKCDVCDGLGSNTNLVRCDECQRCFHFTCLDPPVKKSPKRRGYSWHCADCDTTDEERNIGIDEYDVE